jgi:hypothetical protein
MSGSDGELTDPRSESSYHQHNDTERLEQGVTPLYTRDSRTRELDGLSDPTLVGPEFKDQVRCTTGREPRARHSKPTSGGPEFKDQVRSNLNAHLDELYMNYIRKSIRGEDVYKEQVPSYSAIRNTPQRLPVRSTSRSQVPFAEAAIVQETSFSRDDPVIEITDQNILLRSIKRKNTHGPENRTFFSNKKVILVIVAVVVLAVVVSSLCASGRCTLTEKSTASSSNEMNGTTVPEVPSKEIIGTTAPTIPDNESTTEDAETFPPTEADVPVNETIAPTVLDSPDNSFILDERSESILAHINKVKLSTFDIHYPPGNASCEELAVQWLVEEDPLQLSADSDEEIFRLDQRYALVTIWCHLAGPTWTDSSEWLDAIDECSWFGLSCTYGIATANVTQGIVIQIELDSNNLAGSIPADIGMLSSLEILSLTENAITGTMPSTIGNDLPVAFLALSTNVIRGTIHSSFFKLVHLETLYLEGNQLSGTLPWEIGNLSNLQVFSIDNNRITGSIPSSIGKWKMLKEFYTAANYMNGTIPSDIGNLTDIQIFVIDNNRYTGTLPVTIGNFSQVIDFVVEANRFSGQIPSSIDRWTSIKQGFFSDNSFTGTMPLCTKKLQLDALVVDCGEVECSCCTACS